MKLPEEKKRNKLVELRTQGDDWEQIAKELEVDVETLKKWGDELQENIHY
jgi:transposase-like protein